VVEKRAGRSSDLCLRARGRAAAGFASAAISTSSEDLAGEDLVEEALRWNEENGAGGSGGYVRQGRVWPELAGSGRAAEVEERGRETSEE
jgi:hypothetical protein